MHCSLFRSHLTKYIQTCYFHSGRQSCLVKVLSSDCDHGAPTNTAHRRMDGRYLRERLEQIQLFGPAQVQRMWSAGPEQSNKNFL